MEADYLLDQYDYFIRHKLWFAEMEKVYKKYTTKPTIEALEEAYKKAETKYNDYKRHKEAPLSGEANSDSRQD